MTRIAAVIALGLAACGGSRKVEPPPIAAPGARLVAGGPGAEWAQTINPTANADIPTGIAVDPSGVYVGGHLGVGGPWRVEKRALADGSILWEHVVEPGTYWGARALALDAEGDALFVAGDSRCEKRRRSDGALIATFAGGGTLSVTGRIHDVVVAGPALYLVGETDGGFWIEARTSIDGALLTGFGTQGVVTLRPGSSSNFLLAGAMGDAGLFVAGFQSVGQAPGRVDRRDPSTGALAAGFGISGSFTVDPAESGVTSIAVVDDALYAAWPGRMQRRSATTGALEWADTTHHLNAVAADTAGVAVVGHRGTEAWMIRLWDPGGGSVRQLERDPTAGRDEAQAVALDRDHLYVAGFAMPEGLADMHWRVERIDRDATN
jgi:hypothetical protein